VLSFLNLLKKSVDHRLRWCGRNSSLVESSKDNHVSSGAPVGTTNDISIEDNREELPCVFLKKHEVDAVKGFKAMFKILDCNSICRSQKDGLLMVSSHHFGKEWFVSGLQVSIGYVETLADHDKDFFLKHDVRTILSCVHTMLSVGTYNNFIDLIKYATTWMHARSLKQTLPKVPSFWKGGPPLLFNGSIRRMLKSRLLNGLKSKNQHLFWSIAQLKRCASVVPDDFVESSLVKHRDAMQKRCEDCSEDFFDNFSDKLNIVMKKIKFTSVNKVYDYSTNACYENGRKYGGAKAHLIYKHVADGLTDNDELLKMDFDPRYGVTERRGFSSMSMEDLLDDFEDEQCRAKVYSVCEPLKVRNITAGNALPYAIAKGMQKDMHTSLRQLDQFRLIGTPLTEKIVGEFFKKKRQQEKLSGEKHWIASGDFSAATDNIKISLTKLVFEAILMKCISDMDIKPTLWGALRRVLYEHIIEYPNSTQGLEPVEQQNGQLMGSVLSFPILCIINLIVYWLAVAPNSRFEDLNVLVNGDDIMFACSHTTYQRWLDMLPEAGLTPSPGKNFFHKKYGTVNSALFYEKNRKGQAKYVAFFNAGMLLGQSKVARVQEGKYKPIYCLHSNVLHGALNPERADKRFVFYNKDNINECSQWNGMNLNWYFPRSMGGLGMTLLPGYRFIDMDQMRRQNGKIKEKQILATNQQLQLAHALRNAWYSEDLIKPPFKPIGMADQDPDTMSEFQDIKKHRFLKACLVGEPMPPDAEELKEEPHPANWCIPDTTDSVEEDVHYTFSYQGLLKFIKKSLKKCYYFSLECGIYLKSLLSRLSTDNAHLYQEIVLYAKRSTRVGLRL
jgi:hypothetical protein